MEDTLKIEIDKKQVKEDLLSYVKNFGVTVINKKYTDNEVLGSFVVNNDKIFFIINDIYVNKEEYNINVLSLLQVLLLNNALNETQVDFTLLHPDFIETPEIKIFVTELIENSKHILKEE